MAYYIKVTRAVAAELGLTAVRNKTADGNVLLWQADVARMPGGTVFERAQHVGGVALTPQEAKRETVGTDNPVQVVTPVAFGGTGTVETDADVPVAGQTDETGVSETPAADGMASGATEEPVEEGGEV